MRVLLPIASSVILSASLMANYAVAFAPRVFSLASSKASQQSVLSMADTLETTGMDFCLDLLEKRINEGPGSLSESDVSDFEDVMQRVIEVAKATAEQSTATKFGVSSSIEDTTSDDSDPLEPFPKESSPPADDLTSQQRKALNKQLRVAATQMDIDTITKMLDNGIGMDEVATDSAFWAVVNTIDRAEARNEPLPGNVANMIHLIFEADSRHLLTREQQTTNVTCMQPDKSGGIEGEAKKMNYLFDDSSHKDLPITEGRRCEGGTCCDKCSRNIFPTFASEAEISPFTYPGLNTLTFNELETVKTSTILQFVRLVERVRRTIAHEYGVDLSTLLPLQAYSRKYVAGTTQQGGGGGEGDFVTLHTDEATHTGYHYSSVLYLSSQGEDFEGGDFVFNDPDPEAKAATSQEIKDSLHEEDDDEEEYILSEEFIADEMRKAGRILTPFHPTRGAAVIFSSGWENMHEVEKITSGIRFAVPCFFTTCPVPEEAYNQMKVGKPQTDEDISDDWLHLLLAHRKESPMEAVGRVRELLMKWHYMCTPLSEH
jgi:hypothetical protein